MAICVRCKLDKPPEDFRRRPEKCNGLSSWCVSCIYEARKTRRACQAVEKRERKGPAEAPKRLCTYPKCSNQEHAKRLCSGHYQQVRNGIGLAPLRERGGNRVSTVDGITTVNLVDTRGRLVATTLVDAADWPDLSSTRWVRAACGYAVGGHPQRKLHRVLMSAAPTEEVDHINGDRLDNRRGNLRLVSRAQQAQNVARRARPADRGVYFEPLTVSGHPRKKPWYAAVMVDGIRHKSQFFVSKEEAKVAAVELRRRWCTHSVEDRHQ